MNSAPTTPQPESRLVRVRGRVQGVGFRDGCAQAAVALGVAGWVRNRADGSVEALLHGPSDALDRLQRWLHHGIPAARVDALDVQPVETPSPAPTHFERRPTV